MNNVICIPVYKSTLTSFEELSLRQCFKILSNHPICLVTFSELDCSHYYDVAEELSVPLRRENFGRVFFEGIEGYNKLMLSKELYHRFSQYLYILIYQLDAFVFRDELDYWCGKGYDYIGAPWFENYGGHEDGKNLWAVGNGGFSLRSVRSFLNIFDYSGSVLSKEYLQNIAGSSSLLSRIYTVLRNYGYKNHIENLLDKWMLNEDYLPYFLLKNSNIKIKLPSVEEAMCFSFEKSPSFLYAKNGNRLPFGCHAWVRYEYNSFWHDWIKEYSE